jgi:hypothetical protein
MELLAGPNRLFERGLVLFKLLGKLALFPGMLDLQHAKSASQKHDCQQSAKKPDADGASFASPVAAASRRFDPLTCAQQGFDRLKVSRFHCDKKP